MTNFSIIALKILPNYNPSNIRKIIPNEGGWYFFNQLYKIENNELKQNKEYPLNEDFFGKNLNISAIVGKNGSGKSSLLEFMYRMINNLTYFFVNNIKRNSSERFYYIKDIYGDLYFVINGNLCVLHCRGNFVGLKIGNYKCRFKIQFDNSQSIPLELESYENKNEVLSKEFVEIAKNFFYSIVANYSLLAFLDSDYTEDCSLFYVNGKSGYDSNGVWINSMFHKNDGYSAPIVLNPYRDGGVINLANEYQLTNQRLVALFIESKKKKKQFIDDYQLRNINYKYEPKNVLKKLSKDYNSQDDLHRDFISAWYHNNDNIETYSSVILKAYDYKFPSDISSLSSQKKDAYIYLIYKTLNTATKYPSYSKYSKYIREFSAKEEEDINLKIKLLYRKEDEHVINEDEYLLQLQELENNLKPLIVRTVNKEIQNELEHLVKDILNDHSHITQKIKQTLNFLNESEVEFQKMNSYFTYDTYINFFQSKMNFKGLSEIMNFLPPPIFEYEIILEKVEKVKNRMKISGDNNPISFKTMSSGEKHFLYAVSTLIYHIKNLLSIQQTHRVKYRNINIVLDEIELCFHPEYQRKFINKLIETIKRLKLNNHCAINIILATHSPFLLSDIPNCNILYLQDGEQKKDICIEPFGANIHDILKQNFFLDNGFIGEFAKNKIGEIIDAIKKKKSKDKKFNEDEYEKYKKTIYLIGEPLIKSKIMNMISDVYDNTQDRIEILQKEIESLKNKNKK